MQGTLKLWTRFNRLLTGSVGELLC